MTSRRRARMSSRVGFTLIEMLAVLAIIALIAGLSTQLARPPAPRLRVEAAARALCAAARATRSRAIATRQETTLFFDLARKTFYSPAGGETALPSEARVDVSFATGQRRSGSGAGIVFFPSGGSTGGDITIEISGNRAIIEVNWLTGATRCSLA